MNKMKKSLRKLGVIYLIFVVAVPGGTQLSAARGPDGADCMRDAIPLDPCQLTPLVLISEATVESDACNAVFPASGFRSPPRVLYDNAAEGVSYTLVFLGPFSFLQWLVSDIPDCAFYNGTLTFFMQNAGYLPPFVAPLAGPQVYEAFLFVQTRPVTAAISLLQRPLFNLNFFSIANELCGPVAGTRLRIS